MSLSLNIIHLPDLPKILSDTFILLWSCFRPWDDAAGRHLELRPKREKLSPGPSCRGPRNRHVKNLSHLESSSLLRGEGLLDIGFWGPKKPPHIRCLEAYGVDLCETNRLDVFVNIYLSSWTLQETAFEKMTFHMCMPQLTIQLMDEILHQLM